jgi:RNA polymerase sigma-70 factor (ECF subfamily)
VASDGSNSHVDQSTENLRPLRPLTSVDSTVTELYRLHIGFIERVLRRAGVAERDLADASQEVFVVVHRRLCDFEGRASVRTWLYRIAWNVASEQRRRVSRRRELLHDADDAAEVADPLQAPDDIVDAQQSVTILLDAIERLDTEKREALICHELDEQPMSAVATRLGIPLKTAFSRLYAAKHALRLELRKQGLACLPWWYGPFGRIGVSLRRSRALDPLCSAWPAGGLAAIALLWLAPVQPTLPVFSVAAPAAPVLAACTLVVPPSAAASSSLASEPSHVGAPLRRIRMRPVASPPHAPVATLAFEDLTVVRAGQLDLGLGPFGESPLADPPVVDPQRHPRAKLVFNVAAAR